MAEDQSAEVLARFEELSLIEVELEDVDLETSAFFPLLLQLNHDLPLFADMAAQLQSGTTKLARRRSGRSVPMSLPGSLTSGPSFSNHPHPKLTTSSNLLIPRFLPNVSRLLKSPGLSSTTPRALLAASPSNSALTRMSTSRTPCSRRSFGSGGRLTAGSA